MLTSLTTPSVGFKVKNEYDIYADRGGTLAGFAKAAKRFCNCKNNHLATAGEVRQEVIQRMILKL